MRRKHSAIICATTALTMATIARVTFASWLGTGDAAFQTYFVAACFTARSARRYPALVLAIACAASGTYLFLIPSNVIENWSAAMLSTVTLTTVALLTTNHRMGKRVPRLQTYERINHALGDWLGARSTLPFCSRLPAAYRSHWAASTNPSAHSAPDATIHQSERHAIRSCCLLRADATSVAKRRR